MDRSNDVDQGRQRSLIESQTCEMKRQRLIMCPNGIIQILKEVDFEYRPAELMPLVHVTAWEEAS